jgi:hypothetical protein
MIDEMNARTETEDFALLGAVLNPDTKGLQFLCQEEKDHAMEILKEQVKDVNLSGKIKIEKIEINEGENTLPQLPSLPSENVIIENDSDKSIVESPAKKMKIMCSDADKWLEDVIIIGESQNTDDDIIENEIQRYLDSQRQNTDTTLTLLEWWKCNEYLYPRLAKVAKNILAIPASSVPSERVFSLAGNIVNKKRSRLNADNIDKLIFLNMNMKMYW